MGQSILVCGSENRPDDEENEEMRRPVSAAATGRDTTG